MTTFTTVLENLLELKCLKKSDLVNTLSIPDSTVRNWWNRDSMPAADVCYKVAKYLGVTVEYLLTGEDSEEEAPIPQQFESKVSELEEKYNNLNTSGKIAVDSILNNPSMQQESDYIAKAI